jgi:hypothetical protein
VEDELERVWFWVSFRCRAAAWTSYRPSSICFIKAMWSFCLPEQHK